jgi:protease PrsW
LHGLYDLILFSENISDYYIFILLIVFLIRAYFVFRKERSLQTWSNIKKTKVIPKTSDVIFVVTLTFVILFSVNYFFNFVMY